MYGEGTGSIFRRTCLAVPRKCSTAAAKGTMHSSAWPHTQTHTETHTHTNKHMHTHTGPGSVAFIELQWSLFLSFPKCEAVAQGDCRRSDCNSYFNQLLALGVSLLSQLIKTWIGRRSVYVPMNQCNGILHKSTDTKSNILMNFWRNVAQSALENTTCTF